MIGSVHIKRVLISFFVFLAILMMVFGYLDRQYAMDKEVRYQQVSAQSTHLVDNFIRAKKEKVALIALSLAREASLQDALKQQQFGELQYSDYVKQIAEYANLRHVWVQIIDKEGISVYRSWTKKNGDAIIKKRKDLQKLFKQPEVTQSISVGKFDLTFKTMVPIYSQGEFLGVFEVIDKFNSIARNLSEESIEPVLLVDSSYKKQLTKAFTKRFLNDNYIANLNAKEELVQLIDSEKLQASIGLEEYKTLPESNQFVSFKTLFDQDSNVLANFYLFEDLDVIDASVVKPSTDIYFFLSAIYLLALFAYLWRTAIAAKNVSDKKQQNLRNRNKAILETMVDGVATINKKGIIETVNPATEKIFGYSADEMIGQNVKMLMPSPYRDEHDGYLQNYQETGEKHIIGTGREVEGQRKDGSIFPLELAVSEVEVDGETIYTGIIRDVTERKQADIMKEEFISTVSHELRTPLTSIRGSIGLLTGGLAGEFNDQAKQLLNMAHNNTERLLMLINDILDISKIESGKMDFHFESLSVDKLLQRSIEDNHGYAEQHNVKFVVDTHLHDASIYGDVNRLLQVMNNLMSNAAKFAPDNDEIIIGAMRHHNQIRISVTDHGPGIPKELQPKIFDKFTQADSSDTRAVGGTGLGLNITKAMVEKHNGRIGFVTEEGMGTTFYFDLPEEVRDEDEQASGTMAKTASRTQRILICEDEPDIASLLRLMLAQAGFESDVAGSAEIAQQMLAEQEYDAMTLDIMLPDKNGVDLYKELRKDPPTVNLPIIFVSAKANQTRMKEGESLPGFVEWINKPIDENELLGAIDNSIKRFKRMASNGEHHSILHVEDDVDIQKLVMMLLGEQFNVTQAGTVSEARDLLQKHLYDLMLLDIGLPDGSGLDLIKYIKPLKHHPEVVIFSADEIKINNDFEVAGSLVKARTTNSELVSKIEDVVGKVEENQDKD